MLIATFVSAVGAFGKIDAIGHAPIIAVLLTIVGDQIKEERSARKIVFMPLQYGAALAGFIGFYYVAHAVIFGSHVV